MNPTFLSRFTPSLMEHGTLEEVFVQRRRAQLVKDLVERMRDSALGPLKHQELVFGARGMGKTHLVSLVYHRLRAMDDLRGRLRIAWLREEEWAVASFLDLLLRIAEALDQASPEARLGEGVRDAYALAPPSAERALLSRIEAFLDGQTLLLIVENLDEVFAGLGEHGQQQLRAYLQNRRQWAILATAQSLFGGVSLHTSPFYGWFNVHHLRELDPGDARALLRKIAVHLGNPALARFLDTPLARGRLEAIHHLAGGNPRVYVMLAGFLTSESLDELVGLFLQTVDDLTPYYNARMRDLSPQQRKIVSLLADGPLAVKQIAERSFITQQTASGQLKQLREMGMVESDASGRESVYRIREALLRYVLQAKRHRGGQLQFLVSFLRIWYARDELEARLAALDPGAEAERGYLRAALAGGEDDGGEAGLQVEAFNHAAEGGDWDAAADAAHRLVELRGRPADWAVLAGALRRAGRSGEAVDAAGEAVRRAPDDVAFRLEHATALLDAGRPLDALRAFAALPAEGEWAVPRAWGAALAGYRLGRWDDVQAGLDRLAELRAPGFQELALRAMAHARAGRHDDALAAFDAAGALAATGAERADALSGALGELVWLDRWDEALGRLSAALQALPGGAAPRGQLLHATAAAAALAPPRRWREDVPRLVSLAADGADLLALGSGMLAGVGTLLRAEATGDPARLLDAWRDEASRHPELHLPFRMAEAALRFRETGQERHLLDLPEEERRVVRALLGLPDSDASPFAPDEG